MYEFCAGFSRLPLVCPSAVVEKKKRRLIIIRAMDALLVAVSSNAVGWKSREASVAVGNHFRTRWVAPMRVSYVVRGAE